MCTDHTYVCVDTHLDTQLQFSLELYQVVVKGFEPKDSSSSFLFQHVRAAQLSPAAKLGAFAKCSQDQQWSLQDCVRMLPAFLSQHVLRIERTRSLEKKQDRTPSLH